MEVSLLLCAHLCCDIFGSCLQERLQVLFHFIQSRLQAQKIYRVS